MNVDGTCKEISCKENELKISSSECEKCSQLIEGCDKCSAKDTCTKCIDDKAKIEGGKCVCEHGMNKDGSCKEITCKENELKIGHSECKKCSVLMEGCNKCTSSEVCTECIDSIAILTKGKCFCVTGFDENGKCKKVSSTNCEDDEVKVNGQCKKCSEYMEGCEECDSTTNCKKCIDHTKAINEGSKCVCTYGMNTDGMCK